MELCTAKQGYQLNCITTIVRICEVVASIALPMLKASVR
jgi:hypothetical protein